MPPAKDKSSSEAIIRFISEAGGHLSADVYETRRKKLRKKFSAQSFGTALWHLTQPGNTRVVVDSLDGSLSFPAPVEIMDHQEPNALLGLFGIVREKLYTNVFGSILGISVVISVVNSFGSTNSAFDFSGVKW